MTRRRVLIACVVALAVGVIGSAAGLDARGRTATRDRMLVEALALHRADVPAHWLRPWHRPFPCPRQRRPAIDVTALKTAGWGEAGGTIIPRKMYSRVETTAAPAALYRQRVAELMACLRGVAVRTQPRRLVEAPPGVASAVFHATGLHLGDANGRGYDIVVVRLDRAVAQYVFAYVKPPYQASALAIVRRAAKRGAAV